MIIAKYDPLKQCCICEIALEDLDMRTIGNLLKAIPIDDFVLAIKSETQSVFLAYNPGIIEQIRRAKQYLEKK